jgi:prolyl oligopeptidase
MRCLLVGCVLVALGQGLPELPKTPKKPVTDIYHGVKVTDDYRWLDNANDPAVKEWTEAQNRRSRAVLDQFPQMKQLRNRLQQILTDNSASHYALQYRGDRLFALKSQPPKEQPFLVTLASPDEPGSYRILVDPNRINAKGTTAIDWYVPSRDGQSQLLAVSLSENGTEDGTVHVYNVASGAKLTDVIPRVNGATAGGGLAWSADGLGFYYTRYPRGKERPKEDMDFYQQVYFHKLGTATEQDTYAIGKDFPRIAEITLESSPDGRYVLALVANGDGGEFEHHLLGPSGAWTRLSRFADGLSAATFGGDGKLYVLSRKNAPRGKILRLDPAAPDLAKAETIVSEGEANIEGLVFGVGGMSPHFVATADRLYVADIVGGPSQIRVFDLKGKFLQKVPLPPATAVNQLVAGKKGELLFSSDSFTQPQAWYRFDPKSGEVTPTALRRASPVEFGDVEATLHFATSKDGTKVPLELVRKKGTKFDASNPTLLYAYGGFGISQKPHFKPALRVWLDNGGVYALAHIRGGSEYGADWWKSAQLTGRQRAYDDFAACARWLIDQKVTGPDKLAIEGGSNGGLLMGVALTQHPELFRAVVAHVGIYDMLRMETHPNGAFNVTEYGTVKDPEQFKAMYAYSPMHRVKDRTAYPAVFLLTGANDGRVDPSNSRKMAARLQAATSSPYPVLLKITGGGHGLDSGYSERVAQQADVYAFLFQQLGMRYREESSP